MRSVLALLSLMDFSIPLFRLALDNVFLLMHSVRLHLSVSGFAFAQIALSVRVRLLRSRHVLLLLLQSLRYAW
jgi:hypothetical protein